MTLIPPKTSAVPYLGLQAMNMAGSFSYGTQFGDAIAQIVAWRIALDCSCAPPDDVVKAVHHICVTIVMLVALIINHRFIKNLNQPERKRP
jgi:hypothetical protein